MEEALGVCLYIYDARGSYILVWRIYSVLSNTECQVLSYIFTVSFRVWLPNFTRQIRAHLWDEQTPIHVREIARLFYSTSSTISSGVAR